MFTKKLSTLGSSAVLAILAVSSIAAVADNPLKVFILAGQSNMQGKARVRTIERLKLTEDGKPMYQAMMGKDGTPIVVTDSRDAAVQNAWEHDLRTVSLH